VQSSEPVVAVYVPKVHDVHTIEPEGENMPTAQLLVHAADERPVVAPYVPAGQFVHAVAIASEYWPAAQVLVHIAD